MAGNLLKKAALLFRISISCKNKSIRFAIRSI